MRILAVLSLAALVHAQEFEAATVKPYVPPTDGRFMIGTRGGPGSSDPGRFSATGMSMRDLIATAYQVKRTQVVGPPWIDSERYDVVATMAPTTTKAEFGAMMQKLLAERFKLETHRDKKQMEAFVLTVGKKGPKMKEAAEAPAPKEGDPKPNDPPLPPNPAQMKTGKDGFPQMPQARGGRGPMMMMMMPGRAKVSAQGATMEEFAGSLERLLNKPVVDQTGLKAKFDFEVVHVESFNQPEQSQVS